MGAAALNRSNDVAGKKVCCRIYRRWSHSYARANRKEGFLYPIPDSDLLAARRLIEIHSGRQGENVRYHL